MGRHRRPVADSEATAHQLTGQRLEKIEYFLQPFGIPWDCGVWHAPTMGVQLTTQTGETFSMQWNEYDEWGHGIDLLPTGMYRHPAQPDIEVTTHPSWRPFLAGPIAAAFLWNDYGTGREPMPDAVVLTCGSSSCWIFAAVAERYGSKLSIQLGTDDVMVGFDHRFAETLGLYDAEHGRMESG
jgi:hypothetical protein